MITEDIKESYPFVDWNSAKLVEEYKMPFTSPENPEYCLYHIYRGIVTDSDACEYEMGEVLDSVFIGTSIDVENDLVYSCGDCEDHAVQLLNENYELMIYTD